MKEKNKKESLLSQWKHRKKDKKTTINGISKTPEGVGIPLSNGQRRLWFLQQLYPENPFYNYSEAYTLKGNLLVAPLVEALQRLFKAHSILCSSYQIEDGEIVQKVDAHTMVEIAQFNLSDLGDEQKELEKQRIIYSDSRTVFSLNKAPLFKISLLKIQSDEHLLFITMHHIITDKWSMGIFRKQLAQYYIDLCGKVPMVKKPVPLQYGDYAFWEQQRDLDSQQLQYWKDKLSGEIPILNLPTDHTRPKRSSFNGSHHIKELSEPLSKELLALAKKLEVTPYILLLSVYYLLLYRYTGQEDILIGSPISNRNHVDLEEMIGFFNETVVLRTGIVPQYSFIDLVKKVKQTTFEAFTNNGIPFEILVKELNAERSLGVNPFFQSMFLYHDVPKNPFFGDELQLLHSNFDSKVSKFDLTLYISQENGQLSSTVEYATDLFHKTTIDRFQEHLQLLLQGVVKNPNGAIPGIPMLTPYEKEFFLSEIVKPESIFTSHTGIHQIIEKIALERKNATALVFGDESMSYGELNTKANEIAVQIIQHTRGENICVGLCLERSLDMIVGILGILKARSAYLPIDPEYPKQRIAYMVGDASISLILTQESLSPLFSQSDTNTILIDNTEILDDRPKVTLPRIEPDDLAYVIYTSGSTGKPKGVPISHKNIIESTAGRLEFYSENPKAFLLMSSIAFDSSKAGIFWTLCTGGTLVIAEKRLEQDLLKIEELIASHAISHTLMLPSLYHLILEHCDTSKLQSLKSVIVAGEVSTSTMCKSHFKRLPNTKLYNEYGPTEATVWCIAHEVKKEDLNHRIPIGKPVANAKIYLLDKNLNLVPYGAIGELYVGGEGLSKGYLNRSELNVVAYVQNPFNAFKGKLYKTGDLGRYTQKGTIEFLGRADQQIKIRGFRVELDEIKKALLEYPGIQDVVVIAETVAQNSTGLKSKVPSEEELIQRFTQNQTDGETTSAAEENLHLPPVKESKRLVAYFTGEKVAIPELKTFLASSIPDYMIPATMVQVEGIPRLPNGKTDAKALKQLKDVSQTSAAAQDEPTTLMEQRLLEIWQSVLNIPSIGIQDNFFEIGGDSILSIQIIAKARKEGIVLKANQLFEHQTIAALAVFVGDQKSQKGQETPVEGEIPLTPIQHWFFETHKAAPHYWNQAVTVTGMENEEASLVESVIKKLVVKHDALRSSFKKTNDSWKTIILPKDSIKAFYPIDFTHLNEKSVFDKQVEEKIRSVQENVKLEKGSLFKCLYFKGRNAHESKIFLIAHHLVTDVVSWNILLDDFSSFVSHIKNKKAIDLSKKTDSIEKWGEYLVQLAQSRELKKELPFWVAQKGDAKPFPKDFNAAGDIYKEHNIVQHKSTLGKGDTSMLLSRSNKAYHTKTEDLLVTALLHTICKWTQTDELCIGLEKHGRVMDEVTIDISETVGWFTSFFPISFKEAPQEDIGHKIKTVKEKLRTIPNSGVGYGVLKYLCKQSELSQTPQIIFNYLGNRTKDPNVPTIDFQPLWNGTRHPLSERTYALEINAFVSENELCLYWSYSKELYKKDTISKLADSFISYLIELNSHCTNIEEEQYTPSDFPEANLSQDDLDAIMKGL
ncbi:MAG: amino acid adenylation domain-containing protein [Bacteroidota bacterium]